MSILLSGDTGDATTGPRGQRGRAGDGETLPATIEINAGTASGTAPLDVGTHPVGDVYVSIELAELGNGIRIDWSIHNIGNSSITLSEARIRFYDLIPVRVLAPGWTTSSTVRRCAPDYVVPADQDSAQGRQRDHADLSRVNQSVAAHHVMGHDAGVVGFLHGKCHFGIIEGPSPKTSGPGTAAIALLDGVELLPGEQMPLDPIWIAAGDPSVLLAEFHDHWAVECGAVERSQVRTGIGWWTGPQVHGDVGLLALSVDAAADFGLSHVVLGSGAPVLDDLVDSTRSASSAYRSASVRAVLDPLAARIRQRGLRPGLRCRPFAVESDTSFIHQCVEQAPGKVRFVQGYPVADLTNEAVLDALTAAFAARRAAGWDVFLLEDLWCGAVPGRRLGSSVATRAEALHIALQAIREGAGDDAILIADGVPPGPAAGVVDRVVTGNLGRSSWVHHAMGHRKVWSAGPAAIDLAAIFPEERRGVLDMALAGGGCVALTGRPMTDDLGKALAAYILDLAPAADTTVTVDDAVAGSRRLTAGPFTVGPGPSEYTTQIAEAAVEAADAAADSAADAAASDDAVSDTNQA
jgi:hypothetical protein